MLQEFRVSPSHLVWGVVGITLCVFLGVGVPIGIWAGDESADSPISVCILLAAVFLLIGIIPACLVLAYFRSRLQITGDRVRQVGIYRTRQIDLKDVQSVEWRRDGNAGCLILKTANARMKIGFHWYSTDQRFRLIRALRTAVPIARQVGWGEFYCEYARDPKRAKHAPDGRPVARAERSRLRVIALLFLLLWFGGVFALVGVFAALEGNSGDTPTRDVIFAGCAFLWIGSIFVLGPLVRRYFGRKPREEADLEAEMAGEIPPELEERIVPAHAGFDPATVAIEEETRRQLREALDGYMLGRIDYEEMGRRFVAAVQDSKDNYAICIPACVAAIHLRTRSGGRKRSSDGSGHDIPPETGGKSLDFASGPRGNSADAVAALNRCRLFLESDLPLWFQVDHELSPASAIVFFASLAGLSACLWWKGVSLLLLGAWCLTALLAFSVWLRDRTLAYVRSLSSFTLLPFESEETFLACKADHPSLVPLNQHRDFCPRPPSLRIREPWRLIPCLVLWTLCFPVVALFFPWTGRQRVVVAIHNSQMSTA